MNSKTQRAILLVGNDTTLSYLLGRFAEQSQCDFTVATGNISAQEVAEVNPKAIIFLSIDNLKEAQTLLIEMIRLETLIIVCSSVAEETMARELGVDYCLFHPITYDGFQNALGASDISKRA